jgi:Flp pilus assembly protein TadD
LRDLRREEEAEQSYRRAIQLDPMIADLHNDLGNVLCDLGRREEAELSYRRAIELDPKLAHPHNGLGSLLREIGRPTEAEQSHRRAIEVDPNYVYGHNGLAWHLFVTNGDLDEAERAATKAIELDSNDAASMHTYLAIRVRRGALESEADRFRAWLRMKDAESPREWDQDDVNLFRDVLRQANRAEFIEMLSDNESSMWRPWRQAIISIHEGRVPIEPHDSAEVVTLYQALTAP